MIDCIQTWQQAAGVAGFFFIAGCCWVLGTHAAGWLAGKAGRRS